MSQAKGSSQASKGRHLKNALEYILNPEKTEMGTLIGGSHVLPDADFAFEKMLETKRSMEEKFGRKKTEGRQGYHFVLSFSPKDNVTPEMVMEITKKFIETYIPDYESVYAVHTDKEHLHSHVVFNSVNMINGLKYHYKNGDWAKIIQPITNRLCEEYGLSTIELEDWDKQKESSKNQNYNDSKTQKEKLEKPKKSKPELIQEDINECLGIVKSRQEFDLEMQKRGYEVHRKGATGNDLVHTAVLPPGGEGRRRLNEKQEKILKSLPEMDMAVKKTKRKQKTQKSVKVKHEEKKETKKAVMAVEDSVRASSDIKNNVRDKMDKDGIDIDNSEEHKTEPFIFTDTSEHTEENKQITHFAPFIKSAKIKSAKAGKVNKREDKTYVPVPKKQTVIIVKSMTAAFILDDYGKRRRGKYYREYVKFDVIQKKVKYLHGNRINTMDQLENRLTELYSLRKKLTDRKREIFKDRKKYAKVFRMFKTLEQLRIPVKLYQDGDHTFSKEYEQMKEILAELRKSGMTTDEVKDRYNEFKERLSSIGKLEHMLQKEVKLCEEIKRESIESIQKQIGKQRQQDHVAEQRKGKGKIKNRTR